MWYISNQKKWVGEVMKITHKNCPICQKTRKEPPKPHVPAYKDMSPGNQLGVIFLCWAGLFTVSGLIIGVTALCLKTFK